MIGPPRTTRTDDAGSFSARMTGSIGSNQTSQARVGGMLRPIALVARRPSLAVKVAATKACQLILISLPMRKRSAISSRRAAR